MSTTAGTRPHARDEQGAGPDRATELEDRLRLLTEDLVNLRRRRDEDVERLVAREREHLLREWLDMLDDLERALASCAGASAESLRHGLDSVVRESRRRLEHWGVTRIDVLGHAFDPTRHEAVGLSDDAEPGRVHAEVRPGYLIGEAVLRPAAVVVGRELRP